MTGVNAWFIAATLQGGLARGERNATKRRFRGTNRAAGG